MDDDQTVELIQTLKRIADIEEKMLLLMEVEAEK